MKPSIRPTITQQGPWPPLQVHPSNLRLWTLPSQANQELPPLPQAQADSSHWRDGQESEYRTMTWSSVTSLPQGDPPSARVQRLLSTGQCLGIRQKPVFQWIVHPMDGLLFWPASSSALCRPGHTYKTMQDQMRDLGVIYFSVTPGSQGQPSPPLPKTQAVSKKQQSGHWRVGQ